MQDKKVVGCTKKLIIKNIKMEKSQTILRKAKYLNPYIGGVLLGLVLLASNYISGRGLGASGAMKSVIVSGVQTIAPAHAESALFYKEYSETHPGNPMNSWLVYEMLGVLVGGFLSGILARRTKLKIEHSPKISSKRRLVFALIGGILFGFGSQLGRGCTSGSALSGMAILSLGGFISMMAIFGTAFALAYFFRKNWI
jgi:uncharacterized membrane protein YedE/YeeE